MLSNKAFNAFALILLTQLSFTSKRQKEREFFIEKHRKDFKQPKKEKPLVPSPPELVRVENSF